MESFWFCRRMMEDSKGYGKDRETLTETSFKLLALGTLSLVTTGSATTWLLVSPAPLLSRVSHHWTSLSFLYDKTGLLQLEIRGFCFGLLIGCLNFCTQMLSWLHKTLTRSLERDLSGHYNFLLVTTLCVSILIGTLRGVGGGGVGGLNAHNKDLRRT